MSIEEHNSFYLQEDRRLEPKEYFKFLVKLAGSHLVDGAKILDIGCATGDFLCYLQSLHPLLKLAGVDTSPSFISKAKEALPDARFWIGDIYTGEQLPRELFDLVFMCGVNLYFREYERWLHHLISITSGSAYVFGMFNPEDLDVYATVQRSADKSSSTPWNLISEKSIGCYLDSLNIRYKFIRWQLPFENPRVHEDPMRSWTIETSGSDRLVINGTQMVQRFAVLRIDV